MNSILNVHKNDIRSLVCNNLFHGAYLSGGQTNFWSDYSFVLFIYYISCEIYGELTLCRPVGLARRRTPPSYFDAYTLLSLIRLNAQVVVITLHPRKSSKNGWTSMEQQNGNAKEMDDDAAEE